MGRVGSREERCAWSLAAERGFEYARGFHRRPAGGRAGRQAASGAHAGAGVGQRGVKGRGRPGAHVAVEQLHSLLLLWVGGAGKGGQGRADIVSCGQHRQHRRYRQHRQHRRHRQHRQHRQ